MASHPQSNNANKASSTNLNMLALRSPFQKAARKHPKSHHAAMNFLDELTFFERPNRRILNAVIHYTTNEKLIEIIPLLDREELAELARICWVGLKNLRGWPGRPNSRMHTPSASRPSTPDSGSESDSATEAAQSSLSSTLPGTPSTTTEERTIPITKPPKTPSLAAATAITTRLGIKTHLPNLPSTKPSNSSDSQQPCKIRQENRCLFSGRPLTSGNPKYCHIFPISALHLESDHNKITWFFLALFLGEELRDALVSELNPADTSAGGIHTTANTIAVLPPFEHSFKRGDIGLIPVQQSSCNSSTTTTSQSSSDSEDNDDDDQEEKEILPYQALQLQYIFHGPALNHEQLSYHPANPADDFVLLAVNEEHREGGGGGGVAINRNYLKSPRLLVNNNYIWTVTNDTERMPVPSALLLWWRVHLWFCLETACLTEGYVVGDGDGDDEEGVDEEYEAVLGTLLCLRRRQEEMEEMGEGDGGGEDQAEEEQGQRREGDGDDESINRITAKKQLRKFVRHL